jgi:hypothetical protein
LPQPAQARTGNSPRFGRCYDRNAFSPKCAQSDLRKAHAPSARPLSIGARSLPDDVAIQLAFSVELISAGNAVATVCSVNGRHWHDLNGSELVPALEQSEWKSPSNPRALLSCWRMLEDCGPWRAPSAIAHLRRAWKSKPESWKRSRSATAVRPAELNSRAEKLLSLVSSGSYLSLENSITLGS